MEKFNPEEVIVAKHELQSKAESLKFARKQREELNIESRRLLKDFYDKILLFFYFIIKVF